MMYKSGYSDSISMPGVHKTGNSPGERKLALYIEGDVPIEEKKKFFSEISSFFITKKDLMTYMRMSYEEYHHRTRKCSEEVDFVKLFEDNYNLIANLESSFIELHYSPSERNDHTQLYLNLTDRKDLDIFQNYLWPILIPNQQTPKKKYTDFTLQKIVANYKTYIYMKPIFTKEYSNDELVAILNRDLEDNSKSKEVILHKFIIRMCNFIKDEIVLTDICTRCNLNHLIQFAKSALISCHELVDEKCELDLSELLLSDTTTSKRSDYPLQRIDFGAPGSGKSYGIEKILKQVYPTQKERDEFVFRTTFHPDSDYSSFVGCYKPSKVAEDKQLSISELITELHYFKDNKVSYPCQKFGAKYWTSLKDLDLSSIDNIISSCGFKPSMSREIMKGIRVGESNTNNNTIITYQFSPQVFTNAYLKAWLNILNGNRDMKVFLIIEEINRGNCAQIFGDIFQLLDRDPVSLRSQYPIKPETDLGNYISQELAQYRSSATEDLHKIVWGQELILPENLHIWATMNTSDQSLFPMDSAFKRRWDWKYIPIYYGDAEKYWITTSVGKCNWGAFIELVNKIIFKITNSPDKQIGNRFIRISDAKKEISEDQFINKVLYYLWADVFKDRQDEEENIFKTKDRQQFTYEQMFDFDSKGQIIYKAENIEAIFTNVGFELDVASDGTRIFVQPQKL